MMDGTNKIECLLPFIIELTDKFIMEDLFYIQKISFEVPLIFFSIDKCVTAI